LVKRLSIRKNDFCFYAQFQFSYGLYSVRRTVNIVRLTYKSDVATARLLPSENILRLMRNPLLRSAKILDGLFYDYVIVTEADADRAFYQEINERLLRFMPDLGIPNCLFVNWQGKQTEKTIIRPLRELGIPTVGIVDIDVIKDGGKVWTTFLESGFVPKDEQQSLALMRSAIKLKFEESGQDMKRNGGIEILSESDKEAANNILDRLAQFGLFVARKGEVESWLPDLDVSREKTKWLTNIFEKMDEDPDLKDYIKPTEDDVWDFIGQIKNWLIDPNRNGIPT